MRPSQRQSATPVYLMIIIVFVFIAGDFSILFFKCPVFYKIIDWAAFYGIVKVSKGTKMKDNKKLNTGLAYAAWFGDYAIAATTGVFVAGQKVREDMMAIENLTKWVPVFKTYKKHFVEHVKKHNDDKLSCRAFSRYFSGIQTYNPWNEIDKKKLGDVVEQIQKAHWMSVTYFEETEHQRRLPQFCRVGDYTINFASDGTKWCGGIRGNGYINEYKNGHVATISPELSDYLARLIMQKSR